MCQENRERVSPFNGHVKPRLYRMLHDVLLRKRGIKETPVVEAVQYVSLDRHKLGFFVVIRHWAAFEINALISSFFRNPYIKMVLAVCIEINDGIAYKKHMTVHFILYLTYVFYPALARAKQAYQQKGYYRK